MKWGLINLIAIYSVENGSKKGSKKGHFGAKKGPKRGFWGQKGPKKGEFCFSIKRGRIGFLGCGEGVNKLPLTVGRKRHTPSPLLQTKTGFLPPLFGPFSDISGRPPKIEVLGGTIPIDA